MRFNTRVACFVAFTAAAACGGDGAAGPAAPKAFAVSISAGSGLQATVATSTATPPGVLVKDQYGDPFPGATVTFAVLTGGGSVAGATATTDASGLASSGPWTLGTQAGQNTLSATVAGAGSVTFTATGVAGPATQMTLTTAPSGTVASGQAFAQQPALQLKDVFGNPAFQANVVVTASLASGGGVLGGTLTATTDAGGLAIFTDLSITGAVGPRTLSFSAPGITAVTSGTIQLGAGAATAIGAVGSTTLSGSAGTAVAAVISVLVTDASNNPVPGVAVTFAVTGGGGSVIGGAATTSSVGIATVGSWILGPVVGTNTLTATSGSLTGSPVTFTATATAGAAATIAINAGNNQSATVGTAVTTPPSVLVTDVHGNAVGGVGVTFAVGIGGGSLTGGSATTDTLGIATVGGWTLGNTVGNNTLTATSGSLTGSPLTFTATGTVGAPALMAIAAGDSQVAVGSTPVAIPPAVRVTDIHANPVSGVAVTFAVASGGGSVTGPSDTTDALGIATVGSWTLGAAAGTNTLTATAGSLVATFTATSTASGVTHLALIAQPASAVNAVLLSPQPVVELRDVSDNPVLVPGVTITAAIASGGGTLGGITTVATNASGRAVFTDLSITGLIGNRTLSFTAVGLPVINSAPFNLAAGSASRLGITTQPSPTLVNGQQLGQQPVLQVEDVAGNPVSQAGVTVNAALVGAGATLGGITSQITGAGGQASFTDLSITGTVAGYQLSFSDQANVLSSVTSGTITLQAGPATSVTANSATVQTGRVGIGAPDPPSVVVQDMSGNAVAGVTVTFGVTGGGGSVTGGTQTTDAAGVATVTKWTLGKTVVPNTLNAVVTGLPAVAFGSSVSWVLDQVAAGGAHTCAVTVDGVPYCWGANLGGQVGDSTISQRSTPVPVLTGQRLVLIGAGQAHSCGVTIAGLAFCWGSNSTGQLGVGSTVGKLIPTVVSGSQVFAQINPGKDHTCGVSTAGSAVCWGGNGSGQVGNNNAPNNRLTPQVIAGGYAQVDAADIFTCGGKANGVGNCWGSNVFAQLGDSTKTQRNTPVVVKGGLSLAGIAGSQVHSCGWTTSGTAACWGSNLNGRLAQDTLSLPNNESLVPIAVAGLSGVAELVAGDAHTCALTTAGQVLCWGFNGSGQLGNGGFTNSTTPTMVSLPGGVSSFTDLAAGSAHTCAVADTGALYCWGENAFNQLGNGTFLEQPSPILVSNP